MMTDKQIIDCIRILLANEMEYHVNNGANSSIPDDLIAVADWLSRVEQTLTDKGVKDPC